MASETDTDQKEVRVSVSAHQKERWREHADELGMSQSEFVRTMTQAGRRDFTVSTDEAGQAASEDETLGVDALEDRVFDVLDDDYCSWDELVESLTEDIGRRLETTLQRLQREERIQYSGRHGGYTVTDTDGD